MKIIIHATGSKGNAYSIIDGNHRLLIDPGIRFSRLQQLTWFKIANYDACLLSHEHKDHSMSARAVSRLGVPIIGSRGTLEYMDHMSGIYAVSEKPLEIEGWKILPFETQHDAIEPLGFLIQSPSGKKILYATDTYYIKYKFSGVTHYMVECNYSKKILDANMDMHPAHKDRVIRSHFELENVKNFFRAQDLSKTEKIYLIHLSDDNSDEKLFKNEIEKITGLPVYL